MISFVVVLAALFWLIGAYFGNAEGYFLVGFIVALATSGFSYFFSDTLVLATVRATPADKEKHFDFYTVTENLAIAGGTPMPRLYVIEDASPNAFATGRDPKHAVVCVTTGLLAILDRGELEGVIAHELSHIRNYDILVSTMTAVLVGTIALVTEWVTRSMWWGGGRDNRSSGRNPVLLVIFLVSLVLTPIVAKIIQLAVSRRREFLADASGALLTRNPEGLASALEKITSYPHGVSSATSSTAHLFIANPLRGEDSEPSWYERLFSTHPPAKERIRMLRGS
jgi:heat shock protein HtpX